MDRRETHKSYLGEAHILPSRPVAAGSYGCWTLTYKIGEAGIAVGGGIKVGTDSDTDWGNPQFHDPKGVDYMTITTSGKSRLSMVVESGQLRQSVKVQIHQHPLEEGDVLTLVYGDKTFGGPGSRAQTFVEEKRYFRVSVDSVGDGSFTEIPEHPYLRIIGHSAVQLSIIAPSQVEIGTPFTVVVRAVDKFGNPSHAYTGTIHFLFNGSILSLPETYTFKPEDQGVHRFQDIIAFKPGVCRLVIADEDTTIEGVSNPILCQSQTEEYSLFWGDLHGQVKLSEKISEYFRYARDISAIDFASHQRNDYEVSNKDWEETQRVVKEYNKPGVFIAFLGYEWSGEHTVGGDHNLYYLEDDQPLRRSGHSMVVDKSDVDTDLPHIKDVYREFKEKQVFLIPHIGGRPANLTFHDPALEPVIEIHSTHGTFEWFQTEALKRGYKVGFVAGSDDYKLRLGGAFPGIGDRRFVRGGLMAVYAKELTRKGLFEAIMARRCYGTTGERIIVRIFADGHMMGEEYSTDHPPEISGQVIGTSALERVEIYRGLENLCTFPMWDDSAKPSNVFKITWEGSARKWPYSGLMWDGKLWIENGSISSPDFMPLDRGDETFYEVSERGFKWHTFTCGDHDGASFEVTSETAEIVVMCTCIPTVSGYTGIDRCAPMSQVDRASFRVHVNELGLKPEVVDMGSLNRRIVVRRLAEGELPKEVTFNFVDVEWKNGVNTYWVKVLQSDGEMAWSSPIYVNKL